MTISAETNKVTFAGNGSTTVFASGFEIFDDDDILVEEVNDTTGVITAKTKTTHYTVSTITSPKSAVNITMLTAPASGVTLVLRRNQPLLQSTDYVENDNFPAQTHENNLDKLAMMVQEHEEKLDRAILRNPDLSAPLFLPDLVASKVLAVNSGATAIELTSAAAVSFSSINDLDADTPVSADEFVFYDITGGDANKVTLTNLEAAFTATNMLGYGTGVATFLGTPSSANLASAVTDETGSGSLVFGTSPTLVTPALGTPASGVMTNVTGTAAGLTAGNVTTNANLTGHVTSVGNAAVLGSFTIAQLSTAVSDDTMAGSASTNTFTNKTFDANATGNSLSNVDVADLANGTDGELITWDASAAPTTVAAGSSGEVLTSNGAGAAPTFQAAGGGDALTSNPLSQFAATTSAQLAGVLNDETGSGAAVFATSPTLVTPALGTPASGTLTGCDGFDMELVGTATASSSATIEFTGLSSTYRAYKLIFESVVPATDAAVLKLRTSTDGGSTFESGASDYGWVYNAVTSNAAGHAPSDNDADSSITVVNTTGNDTGEQANGTITFYGLSEAKYPHIIIEASYENQNGFLLIQNGMGVRHSAADVDAIQILMSTGNIASGEFRLYGMRNA
jgi:hypothetical protein